jgi:HD-like signal output (HDOD) protein
VPKQQTAGTLTETLMEELQQLPPSRAAALRVVQVVDDSATSSADVASAASVDPALTARILRVANSAYYGLSGRVGTPAFAVTVVGFQTVRSLAALSAAGIAGDEEMPGSFWLRAARTASGASLVARRVGAPGPEAFCAGLLHALGSALLHRYDRTRYAVLLEVSTSRRHLLELERKAYGSTHAQLCADVLVGWQFPSELTSAIRQQDIDPREARDPLLRALIVGRMMSDHLIGDLDAAHPDFQAALTAAQVRPIELRALLDQVDVAAEQLVQALSV